MVSKVSASDIFEDTITGMTIVNPHMALCGHSYGLDSWQKIRDEAASNHFRCPDCRADVTMDRLIKNFTLAASVREFESKVEKVPRVRLGQDNNTDQIMREIASMNLKLDEMRVVIGVSLQQSQNLTNMAWYQHGTAVFAGKKYVRRIRDKGIDRSALKVTNAYMQEIAPQTEKIDSVSK